MTVQAANVDIATARWPIVILRGIVGRGVLELHPLNEHCRLHAVHDAVVGPT